MPITASPSLVGGFGGLPPVEFLGCCRGVGCGRGLSSIALAVPCIQYGLGRFRLKFGTHSRGVDSFIIVID